jgi:peptidoglycan/LPS O-acetylase OafA/YrhL
LAEVTIRRTTAASPSSDLSNGGSARRSGALDGGSGGRARVKRQSSSRPASKPRDPALDGLRGVAVLMVFVFHYGGGLQSRNLFVHGLGVVTEAGWAGVVLFFALSGFLITGSLWDSFAEPRWLRNFYARRALRILPLYYVVIFTCAVLAVAHGSSFVDIKPFWIFAFFLQDLPFLATRAIQTYSPLPLYHLWSLAVEEQFYLLWPVLLLTVRGNRRGALRLSLWVFAVCAVFRLAIYGLPGLAFARQENLFDSFLLTHAGALALGAAIALALRSSKHSHISGTTRFVNRHATALFLSGLALFFVSSILCKSFYLTLPLQFMLGLPGVSLACAALIPIVLRPGLGRHIFSFAPLGWLGRISYGFYIFHILLQPIFDFLAARLTHTASGSYYQTVRLMVAFPITLIVAWLSFHLLEFPFLLRKRRYPMHQPLP